MHKKEKRKYAFEKTTGLDWQGLSRTKMFSSKTVNDLTKSIIHSHQRLIHVRRFTSVHEVKAEESKCK